MFHRKGCSFVETATCITVALDPMLLAQGTGCWKNGRISKMRRFLVMPCLLFPSLVKTRQRLEIAWPEQELSNYESRA